MGRGPKKTSLVVPLCVGWWIGSGVMSMAAPRREMTSLFAHLFSLGNLARRPLVFSHLISFLTFSHLVIFRNNFDLPFYPRPIRSQQSLSFHQNPFYLRQQTSKPSNTGVIGLLKHLAQSTFCELPPELCRPW